MQAKQEPITINTLLRKIELLSIQVQEISSKIKTDQQLFDGVLLNAAEKGNIKTIHAALDLGANIKAQNEKEQTALHLSVIHNHQEITDFLLEKEPSLFFHADSFGYTPIQQSSHFDNLERLDWLYEKGKIISQLNVNQEVFDSVYSIAPLKAQQFLVHKRLIESAKTGKIEGIKDALKKGVNINIKADDGETALHKAVFYKYIDVAQLLIEKGADPTILNNKPNEAINGYHESVLDMCIGANNQELIAIVSTSFLIFAAKNGVKSDISIALERGAHLTGTDFSGQIALHKAVINGNKEGIKLLLKKHVEDKVDIYITDKEGNTPYDLAVKSGAVIKTNTEEKKLAIYLSEKLGSYKKESKIIEKIKLSQSSLGFFASEENNLNVNVSSMGTTTDIKSAIPQSSAKNF